ncbi:MAG TPA: ATP-binding cassette domain-containing protein [candidate division Zixibacteria bacterium]|nr:ATP-binding cassette domain-containing protein [candidate division Zixibacteria bacterium]
MISLRNVTFGYGDKIVLRNVSFDVADNEAIAVMGPSGSGKSTVLRLILGLECPYSGDVIVDGHNLCLLREREKREIRKQIGMVFQDGALFDSLTVGENVGYYLIEHTKLSWTEVESKASEMLGFVGLDSDEVIDKLPEQLSGGMQRRVAIGRALLSTNPRVMLYDEPTTGLDPQSTDNVLALIKKLKNEKTVASIVVTHQIADAFAIADRYVVIVDGQLVFDGRLEALRDCTEPLVVEFLKPFRSSMQAVLERRFVTVGVNGGV